jgi:membrane protein
LAAIKRRRRCGTQAFSAAAPRTGRALGNFSYHLEILGVSARTLAHTPHGPRSPGPWLRAAIVGLLAAAFFLENRRGAGPITAPPRGAPSDLGARDWRHAVIAACEESNEDQITTVAAGVTYFGVLALFPALAAFVSLYGLVFDVAKASQQLAVLAGVLPRGMVEFIGQEMVRVARLHHTGLSFGFIGGLLFSIVSANAGMKALFRSLNVAYEVKEARGIVRLNLFSLGFTLAAIALVGGAFAIAAVLPKLFAASLAPGAARLLTWPLLAIAMTLALAVLYRYGPCRPRARWRWVTPGSLVASVVWLAASAGYSWYLASFGHYEKTYGSLGAIVGLMVWLWITVTVALFGAELNLEVEREGRNA